MNIALPLPRPSQRRLEKLLETKPAKFEKYLARYPELADLFEDVNPFADLSGVARRTLESAVSAPFDFAARMRTRLVDEQQETSPFAVLLDLTGVGLATLKMLADDEPLDT